MPSPNLRTAWYLILHCRIGAGNRAAAVALTLRWTRWYLRSCIKSLQLFLSLAG